MWFMSKKLLFTKADIPKGGMQDGGYLGDITQISGWMTVSSEYELTEEFLKVRSLGNYAMFFNNSIYVTGGLWFKIEGYIVTGGQDTWISSRDIVYLRDNMIDSTHFRLELPASIMNSYVNFQVQVRGDSPSQTEIVFTKIYLE